MPIKKQGITRKMGDLNMIEFMSSVTIESDDTIRIMNRLLDTYNKVGAAKGSLSVRGVMRYNIVKGYMMNFMLRSKQYDEGSRLRMMESYLIELEDILNNETM